MKIKKITKVYFYLSLLTLFLIIFIAVTFSNLRRPEIKPALSASGVQEQSYIPENAPQAMAEDLVFGPPDAPLKIFVYENYSDKYSAQLSDTLERIKAEAGNGAAVIVRPYFNSNSAEGLETAVAVSCAADQGKWKEMRALLFMKAKNRDLNLANMDEYAGQIGLDGNAFSICLTNQEKSGKIEKSVQDAAAYSVQGAPTIFVGDEMINGARPYDDFTDSNGDKIEGLKSVVERQLNR